VLIFIVILVVSLEAYVRIAGWALKFERLRLNVLIFAIVLDADDIGFR
jgi:hypothetical protein